MADRYAIESVDDGVWSVVVPRPGGGVASRIYALRSDEGYALVDAGWDTEDGLEVTALAVKAPTVECFAPVTTVALVLVGADRV